MLPGLEVRLGDVIDRGCLGQVDRLRDRPADEWLDRAHHLDVAHVADRAHAVLGLERAVEHVEVLVLQARGAFDRALLLDVRGDR